MSHSAATRLAWSLCASFVVIEGTIVWLVANGTGESDEALGMLLIGYAVIGALIASRRPRNPVGWLLIGIALAFSIQAFCEVYVASPSNPGYAAAGVVAGWVWYIWFTLVVVFLPLVFPDGRLLSRRWRPVLWLALAALACSIVGATFKPGELDLSFPIENPLGASGIWADVVAGLKTAGDLLSIVAFLLTAASLVLRIRRARGIERQQLKWFALVGLVALTGITLAMFEVLVPGGWRLAVGAVGWFTFLFTAVIGVPAATGVAILRHRLYDIDVVINRTLVYVGLTATLAGAYLGGVLLLGLALSPLTEDSKLAVAGSTLAVAGLFGPARARIQAAVDRRFYRRRYDAARTLEAFGGRLRDELDLEALGADLRWVVRDTVQPAHVSLWLRSPR